MHPEKTSDLEWRRLQVHEQQSERQKKSHVQKALIFARRAQQKLTQERGCELSIITTSHQQTFPWYQRVYLFSSA